MHTQHQEEVDLRFMLDKLAQIRFPGYIRASPSFLPHLLAPGEELEFMLVDVRCFENLHNSFCKWIMFVIVASILVITVFIRVVLVSRDCSS